MSEDVKLRKVRGVFPILGMVIRMALTVACAVPMLLVGVASMACRWGAQQFRETL